MFDHYLSTYTFCEQQLTEKIDPSTKIIVVIPAYKEAFFLDTLNDFELNEVPNCGVEVILVFNCGEHVKEEEKAFHQELFLKGKEWSENKKFKYHFLLHTDLPKKHAGVGLARKIGMDEALYRFNEIQQDGLLVCYDADAKTANNYLLELEKCVEDKTINTICIGFEHNYRDKQFNDFHNHGIACYELFLRYYSMALQYTGFPYYHHTIGSSMAVRASVYAKQGGMNKRKAGEDFYFLQKLFPLGGVKILNETRVFPSGRTSDRVPFGTGKAINDWLIAEQKKYATYDFSMFPFIREMIDKAPELYGQNKDGIGNWLLTIHPEIRSFLLSNDFVSSILGHLNQSNTLNRFMYKFYEYMNGFRMLKLVHYLRDNEFDNIPLENAVFKLLEARGIDVTLDVYQQLERIKKIDLK